MARSLGWSESKLSRIETARTGISDSDLDRLLATYGARAEVRDRLRDLAHRGRARVWWTPYRSSVPDSYDEYVALEAEALAMSEWETQIVPGLLQTDEYARAVIEVGADIGDPDTAQRRLALRMARQTVLVREPPPRLTVVLVLGMLTASRRPPQGVRSAVVVGLHRSLALGEHVRLAVAIPIVDERAAARWAAAPAARRTRPARP